MKKVLILDDGVSYFTDPILLQKVYGRFWDEGIPTCVAITPALSGTIRSANDNTQYYGGIAAEKRGEASPFKVSENQKLCRYMNVMAEQRLVEVCIRGYNGDVDEFDSDDDVLLQQKIEIGQSKLQHALPNAEINTFVLPQNTYSKTAIQLLEEYDFNICSPALSQQTAFEKSNRANNRKFFSYSPTLYDTESSLSLVNSLEFVIIRQAYWMFYDDTLSQTNALFDDWQILVSKLLKIKNLEIDTFSFI